MPPYAAESPGGPPEDVTASPPSELFSETNDNPVGIVLICDTGRVLLASDDEAKEEEYMPSGSYARP